MRPHGSFHDQRTRDDKVVTRVTRAQEAAQKRTNVPPKSPAKRHNLTFPLTSFILCLVGSALKGSVK